MQRSDRDRQGSAGAYRNCRSSRVPHSLPMGDWRSTGMAASARFLPLLGGLASGPHPPLDARPRRPPPRPPGDCSVTESCSSALSREICIRPRPSAWRRA
jgi:hypothetical protein